MTDHLFALVADKPRTIRGRLLPYGEPSRPNVTGLGPVTATRGSVTIPRDPSIITLNRDHDRFDPIGRGALLEETDAGVDVEFAIADTPEGDAYLAEYENGGRRALSPEIAGLVHKDGQIVGGRITGAAALPEGAFAGAQLFAIGDVTAELEGEDITALVEAVADILAKKSDEASASPDPAATAAAEPNGDTMTGTPAATIPAGLTTPPDPTSRDFGEHQLFAAIIAKDSAKLDAVNTRPGELFAIGNVQHAGPTTLTIGADTQVPQAVQELWKRRPYERKFTPLFNAAALTSMKVVGWRWLVEPVVAAYTGNNAEIPSNTGVDTEPVTADAQRIAGGHKLDRRFRDFPDQGVVESYFRVMTESYARVSDQAALSAATAGATASSPTSSALGQPKALAGIIDGAIGVINSENTPSFAVVDIALWRDLMLQSKDNILGYVSASLGLENGELAGFKIIPAPTAAVGAGKVLVGAKEAMTVYELPGVPIRVEGLDPHHGAFDPALFGYYATIVNNAAALQLVTVTGYTA